MASAEELALFETVIPRHQPVTDHARFGKPTVWLRRSSSVAVAYRQLSVEVSTRLEARAARAGGSLAAQG